MTDTRDVQVLTDPVASYACPGCGATLPFAGLKPFTPFTCSACGLEMQVPARLGNFVLLELLGAGGMGGTYRAHDEALNRDVAIKVMRKSLGDDPAFLETFRREAQSAARLNHPNVVQIHSFGEVKGQPYIVMELIGGGSLDKLIGSGEPLDQSLVVRIGVEIASALQHGYQSQLVHGDIKPENIMLDEKGAAKLVDFGIAQMAGRDSGEVWGTPYYVAPEKVRRQRADCRADIYSLGGTLYHALAAKPPFDGPDATAVVKARFLGPAQPLREIRPDIDPEVEALIARMLQIEPPMRHPTYESLLGDMRRYLDRAGPAASATKKLLIVRKKGGTPTAKTQNVTKTTTSVAGSAPAAVPPPAKPGKLVIQAGMASTLRTGPSESAAAPAPEAAGGGGRRVWIALLAVALLGGAAFGGWYLWKHRQPAEKPGPAAPAPSQEARAAAQKRILRCEQDAQSAATNLTAMAEEGGRIVRQAADAVAGVLGEEARQQLTPARPAEAPPAAAATNAPPAETPAAPPPAAEAEPSGLPAAGLKVRAMHRAWYRLEAIAAQASAESRTVLAEGEAASASTNAPDVLAQVADALAVRVAPLLGGPLPEEAGRTLKALQRDLGDVTNQVAALVAERARQEQERLKQEAERQRLLAQQKAEEERKAKIAAEVAGVQEKERALAETLHQREFGDARRQLRSLAVDLKYEEGRKALDLALERVKALEDLRDFLAAHVPGFEHPTEGWRIEKADRNGVTVKNRGQLKDMTWTELGDLRTIMFLRVFLMDEAHAGDLKLREHVRQLIGAALYMRLFVPDDPRAQELAGKMLEKAVSLLPDAKIDIDRLVPGGIQAAEKPADAPAAAAAP
jgi:hypothetical protein